MKSSTALPRVVLAALGCLVGLQFVPAAHAADGADGSSLAVFNRRILPILQAKSPSSCSECHLSGVDLKGYIRDDQQGTFAALRDAGLVNVKDPDSSKILQFIARKPAKPSIVNDRVRGEEHAAFQTWLRAAVKDPQLLASQASGQPAGPSVPLEVVRHARQDRVLASFLDNIWSEVGRCAACHSPDRNQQQVKKHGPQVSWIKLGDPQATLDYLLEAELIDSTEPAQSLLLKKPTMQVDHGGGIKMVVGDRSYKQFRRFLDDYAALRAGRYRTASELPTPASEVSQVSELWFKIEGVPKEFDKLLLQVDIYRWDAQAKVWSNDRVATGDRSIAGDRNLWQQHLTLTASRGSADANRLSAGRLSPGKYLAKIYIDREGNLGRDFRAELGAADHVGEVEFDAPWRPGYGQMTVIRFPNR